METAPSRTRMMLYNDETQRNVPRSVNRREREMADAVMDSLALFLPRAQSLLGGVWY